MKPGLDGSQTGEGHRREVLDAKELDLKHLRIEEKVEIPKLADTFFEK